MSEPCVPSYTGRGVHRGRDFGVFVASRFLLKREKLGYLVREHRSTAPTVSGWIKALILEAQAHSAEREGISLGEIAERMGIDEELAAELLLADAAHLSCAGPRRSRHSDQWRGAVQRYFEVGSTPKVAKELNVSPSNVLRWVKTFFLRLETEVGGADAAIEEISREFNLNAEIVKSRLYALRLIRRTDKP